ncbi:glycosyltransferase family 2 protein [Luteimonas sp. MJ246]|uniref:glycosyltransferase family 2 protein n=1 Tax=Luteimonas sp. MJ174 TaxID=3129237 RepID=UPI0031B9B52D
MQPLLNPALSVVVPVYGNARSIPQLLQALAGLARQVEGGFEAVFVVDGSPDDSHALLGAALPGAGFTAQLVELTRNFGAFPAIRVGLGRARGRVIAVMAADLQEPPELAPRFLEALRDGRADVGFGVRDGREDPALSRLASNLFWSLYRRLVMPDIPCGGVDIFAVTADFRDRLLALQESNTSLVAQLFWLGGRRVFLPYSRRRREHGRSAWTLRKKLRYFSDSVFAFSDLPVRILFLTGALALATAALLALVVLVARASGWVTVPGYAATLFTILFFGAINTLGLGVVGSYAWRTFENTKARPLALVHSEQTFEGDD